MRTGWPLLLVLLAGCAQPLLAPEGPAPTPQVHASPFAEPGRPTPTKVNYAPASQEVSFRVVVVNDKLLDKNPQFGRRPEVIAIGSGDPEIFHVGVNQIYITEGLVKQCETDGQLAAVLANELGRIVSEREAAVTDEARQPERLLPIYAHIGGVVNARDADPLNYSELGQYEKLHPKQTKKLTAPNPQLVARDMLERAGYQRTELDAAAPILQNAERFRVLENQFKGPTKQSEWKGQ